MFCPLSIRLMVCLDFRLYIFANVLVEVPEVYNLAISFTWSDENSILWYLTVLELNLPSLIFTPADIRYVLMEFQLQSPIFSAIFSNERPPRYIFFISPICSSVGLVGVGRRTAPASSANIRFAVSPDTPTVRPTAL